MYLKKELYELIRTDESIFDFIQDSALDGLWYWDLEHPENEWINARFWTVLGYNPDEMPHKSTAWQNIINQDDLKVANENFTKHCENPNHPYDQVVRYTHKNGSTVWIRCRGLAIRDENGKVIRMLGAHQDISDIKRKEQELIIAKEKAEESEAKYSTLFTLMSEMVVLHELVFDENGEPVNYRITECNDAFTIITGIPRKNAIGRLSTEVYGTEQPPYFKEYTEVVLTGEPCHYETYFQPMDKHFSVSVISPAKNQFATVTTDITAHKQAENELKLQNVLLKTQQEVSIDGILIVNEYDKIVSFNQRFADIWEIPDEIMALQSSEKALQYVLPKLTNPDEFAQRIHDLQNNKREKSFDEVFLTDGKILERYSSPLIGPDDEYFGRIWYYRDITERKQLELELAESLERFKELHNASFGGIAIHDKGIILECNKGLSEMLGYSLEELIGMNGLLLIAPEYREMAMDKIATGYEKPYEADGLRKNGDIFPMRLEARNIPYKGKKVRTVEFRDITESKQAEQQIIAAKEKAEESDRLKSAFLANMSHEIRTPMNGILGFAELLKESDLKSENRDKYIGIIEKSGARMLNIIDDIVDISKIEAGQMDLNISESNIAELIEEIYSFFKPEAEAKKISLSFKHPLSAKEAIIKTDREKLYAVLANLVKNAIKYTHEGSIELGCNLTTRGESNILEFYTKDTGIGISKDRQKAIFERFIQADIADKMAYQGAGLGLAISKAYVEMLGGEIWIESQEGKGSTFYFTLPYKTDHQETDAQNIDESTREKEDQVKNLKILIVEDDELSAMLMSEYVQTIGKEILQAGSGGARAELEPRTLS